MKFSSGPDVSLMVENQQLRSKIAKLEQPVKRIQSSLLCQLPINNPNGSTTYCMRPMNHKDYDPKGKCAIDKQEGID